MGTPLDVSPHEALLHAIQLSAGEVAYCSEQIARLGGAELFEIPTTVTYGYEDGIDRFEERQDPEIMNRWVSLRQLAVDRMAKYSKMALDAGIDERRVQLAERVASIMEPLLKSLAEDLQLTPSQREQLPAVLGARLRALEGTATDVRSSNGSE